MKTKAFEVLIDVATNGYSVMLTPIGGESKFAVFLTEMDMARWIVAEVDPVARPEKNTSEQTGSTVAGRYDFESKTVTNWVKDADKTPQLTWGDIVENEQELKRQANARKAPHLNVVENSLAIDEGAPEYITWDRNLTESV